MNNISVEKDMKRFLRNLVWLREQHHLSREEMAEILNISLELWGEVEAEKIPTNLTTDIFYKIAEYFKILPSDILYKELWI